MHKRRLLIAIPAVLSAIVYLLILLAISHEVAQTAGGVYIVALLTASAAWDVLDRNGNGRRH